MRDGDDGPYFVIEREAGGGIGSFILGALVGAGVALLFAPKSGEETQEEIKTQALRLKSSAQDKIRDTQDNLEERLVSARENVHARVEGVKDAVESGRKAASEAREDLELKLQRSKAAYRAGIDAAKEVGIAGATDESDDEVEESTEE